MRIEEFISGLDHRYKADDAIDLDIDSNFVPSVPLDVKERMKVIRTEDESRIGADCYMVWRQKFSSRWSGLDNKREHYRLRDALQNHIYDLSLLRRNN